MIIKVTEDDIKKGVRGSACGCPIALAIKRAADADIVSVYKAECYFKGEIFELPPEAQYFIRVFDKSLVVSPMEFTL